MYFYDFIDFNVFLFPIERLSSRVYFHQILCPVRKVRYIGFAWVDLLILI